jgi:hypothetical protein
MATTAQEREIPVARLVKRATAALPESFDEVTADVVTQLLRPSYPGVVVRSATVSHITEGSGSRARLSLTYNEREASLGLPPSMWLKSCFNLFREHQQKIGGMLGEAIFYRFAPELPLRVPCAYYAGFDARGQGLVLLEDLQRAGATFFDASTPLTPAQALDALDQLALLHGSYWCPTWDPVPDVSWPVLPNEGPLGKLMRQQRIPEVPVVLERPHLKSSLPPNLNHGGRLQRAVTRLIDLMSEPPYCVVHFDAHLGNLYADRDGRLGFVDWQFFRVGAWFQDVGYFIGGALTSDDRRRWESDLLKHYLDRLGAHGGEPPDFDTAWPKYVAGQLWGLWAWIMTRLEMQSLLTINTFLDRYVAAVADLGAMESLS